MMRASSKRHGRAAAAAALAVVLAGCGPSPAGLDADTARELQSTVAEVRQTAGGGDFASALAALDRLTADVERGAGEGRIGAERKARISEAIALVRADVQAQLDAAQTPPAATPPAQPRLREEPGEDKEKDEQEKDEDKKDDGPGEKKGGGKGQSRG